MNRRVNLGCGTTPTLGWINLDNSPAIKIANSPLVYRIFKSLGFLNAEQIKNIEWNKKNKIVFGDASKRFPFEDKSIEVIYTSHMLEHLSQSNVENVLKEARRVLQPGGIIRIAVPDLRIIMEDYFQSGDANLCMERLMVQPQPINTLKQKLKLLLVGYRHHQWMYDGNSISKMLVIHGFKDVEIMEKGHTKINDPGPLDLNEREGESVYVEAVC